MYKRQTQGLSAGFWNIVGGTSNNASTFGWLIPPSAGNAHHMPSGAYFKPTSLNSEVLRMSRFSAHNMESSALAKLTSYSGKRVHMDVWTHRHSYPWYLLGKLRQIRVGDDGYSRTTLKSGGNPKTHTLGARLNAIADCMMFDNE